MVNDELKLIYYLATGVTVFGGIGCTLFFLHYVYDPLRYVGLFFMALTMICFVATWPLFAKLEK